MYSKVIESTYMARSIYIGNIARDGGWRHVGAAIEVYRMVIQYPVYFRERVRARARARVGASEREH